METVAQVEDARAAVGGLWHRLVRVSPSVTDPVVRSHARLAAGLALVSTVLTGAASLQAALLAPAAVAHVVAPVLVVTTTLSGVGYLLARTGRVLATVALLMFLGLTSPAITLLTHDTSAYGATALAAFAMIPVLTSTALLRSRGVLLVSATVLAAVVGTLLSLHEGGQNVAVPILLLVTTSTILVVASRHREAVERLRQAALQHRNEELQRLRDTLEERVAARTRDIERSHSELAHAYADLQANQEALVASEKMALLGRLTAGVAHEMNSPLGAILASVDHLETLVDEYGESIGDATVTDADHREIQKELHESVQIARLATERATSFVRSIKSQTRTSTPGRVDHFDMAAVVHDAVLLLQHQARAARCKVNVEAPARPVPVDGDAGRLAQAVTNLVSNAIDATGESGGGEVRVTIARQPDVVVVEVHDQGAGIPADILPSIFEPLFTTKPFGRGTGLGLAITREVVERDFGGSIAVDTSSGGSCFRLELPTSQGVDHAA